MNDIYIYKEKAEKYKYKYLKLKQELEGGEYLYNECKSNPPKYFDNETLEKLIIEEDYPKDNTININSFSNNYDYVGRLIKSKTNRFYDEYNIELTNSNKNYKIIESLQNSKMLEYIPKIVYACTIKNDKSFFSKTSFTYDTVDKFFPHCTKRNKSKKYGYIITTNIGINITYYISTSDLIKFIKHLIVAIENFIIPLHNASYVLNNIDLNNIYWNEQQVFFNISKMKYDTNMNTDIKNLIKSIKTLLVSHIDSYSHNNYYENVIEDITTQIEKLRNNNLIIILNNIIIYLNYNKLLLDYKRQYNTISESIDEEYKLPERDWTGFRFPSDEVSKNNMLLTKKLFESIELKKLNEKYEPLLINCIEEVKEV
jgi:hypothetical protein